MSTKIFYAYRVDRKTVDLMEMLWKFSEIATEYISQKEAYLKLIHTAVLMKAAEDRDLYNIISEDHPEYRKKFRNGKEIIDKYLKKRSSLLISIFNDTGI